MGTKGDVYSCNAFLLHSPENTFSILNMMARSIVFRVTLIFKFLFIFYVKKKKNDKASIQLRFF